MIAHHIAPVDPETEIVYGACRPGYPATEPDETDVAAWLAAIENHGIKRVCCLLSADQLRFMTTSSASISADLGQITCFTRLFRITRQSLRLCSASRFGRFSKNPCDRTYRLSYIAQQGSAGLGRYSRYGWRLNMNTILKQQSIPSAISIAIHLSRLLSTLSVRCTKRYSNTRI